MTIVLYVLLSTFVYLVIGTALARNEYARAIAGPPSHVQHIAKEIKNLNHGGDCWLGPRYKKNPNDYNCDCRHRDRYLELKRVLEQGGGYIAPPNPYRMLTLWPLIGYDSFLKGGAVKQREGYDPNKVEELEQDVLKELDV